MLKFELTMKKLSKQQFHPYALYKSYTNEFSTFMENPHTYFKFRFSKLAPCKVEFKIISTKMLIERYIYIHSFSLTILVSLLSLLESRNGC